MSQEAITEIDMDVFARRISPYLSWLESKIESGWEQSDTVSKDILKEVRYLSTTMRARFILGVTKEDFAKEVARTIELLELACDAFPRWSEEIDSKLKHFLKGIAGELGADMLPENHRRKIQERINTARVAEVVEQPRAPEAEIEPEPEIVPKRPDEQKVKRDNAKIKKREAIEVAEKITRKKTKALAKPASSKTKTERKKTKQTKTVKKAKKSSTQTRPEAKKKKKALKTVERKEAKENIKPSKKPRSSRKARKLPSLRKIIKKFIYG